MRVQVFDYNGNFLRAYDHDIGETRCCPYANIGLEFVENTPAIAATKWMGTAHEMLPTSNMLLPPVCDNATLDAEATAVFLFILGRAVGPLLANESIACGQVSKQDYSNGNVLATAANNTVLDYLPWGSNPDDPGWVTVDLDYDPVNHRLVVLQCIGVHGQGTTNNNSFIFVYDDELNLLARFGYDVSTVQYSNPPPASVLGALDLATAVMVNSTAQEIYVVDAGTVPAPALLVTPEAETQFYSPSDAGYLNGPFAPPGASYTLSMLDQANSHSGTFEWTASVGANWVLLTPGSGSLTLTNGSSSSATLTLTPQPGEAANSDGDTAYLTQLQVTDVTQGSSQGYNIYLLECAQPVGQTGFPLASAVDHFGFRHLLYVAGNAVQHALYSGNTALVGAPSAVVGVGATGVQLTIRPDGSLLANIDGLTPSHYRSSDNGNTWAAFEP